MPPAEKSPDKPVAEWLMSYSMNPNTLPTDMRLWARRSGAVGGNHAAIIKVLEQRAGKINTSFADTLASGYAGFRFGKSFSKEDPLLNKSSMVGILTEVRAGPLNGLRWNWDFGPEVSTIENGQKLSFTWSRATLGWSFGFPFERWISKVDVVPKIGSMSLDSTIGLSSAISRDIVEVARFRQKDVLNLGIEAGVETELPWFLVRVWGASDISGFVNIDDQTTVSSLRGGVDAYMDVFQVFDHYRIALLAFASLERISFEKKDVSKDQTVGTSGSKLAGISYKTVYAGAGITLRW